MTFRPARLLAPLAVAATLGAAGAQATVLTGLDGEFFDMDGQVSSLAQVDVRFAAGADGTFTATTIDYDAGAGDFRRFLGADAPSFVGTDADERNTWAVRLTGFVYLDVGDNLFTVRSDDGFALRIDGQLVSDFDANRGARDTIVTANLGDGWFPIELIMWENGGRASLRFSLNDAVVGDDQIASAVPVPAAAVLFPVGLAVLGRRRRRQA